jgi:hypothetical protein
MQLAGRKGLGEKRKILLLIFRALLSKGKAIPFTGLDRPSGFQEVEAPRF